MLLALLFTATILSVTEDDRLGKEEGLELSNDDWPMFHHGPTHTGYTESEPPKTNQTSWIYEIGDFIPSSPAVADGMVFVGATDRYLYALNETNGRLLWKYMPGGGIHRSQCPAVASGMVFIGTDGPRIFALNQTTGFPVWTYETGGCVRSPPTVVGNRVYVGCHDNNLYCLDAATGMLIWSYRTDGNIFSSPAVYDGMVFLGSGAGGPYNLYALNASTGELLWRYPTRGEVYSSPAVDDGRVFFGCYDGRIRALDISTGTLLWSYTTGCNVFSSPSVAKGRVYIGSGYLGNDIYCLDATGGELVWKFTTGDRTFSSPAVADGIVYVGSFDTKIYALNGSTGTVIWTYFTGDGVFSSPALANGRLFVSSGDGKIHAIGLPPTPTPPTPPTPRGKIWTLNYIVHIAEYSPIIREETMRPYILTGSDIPPAVIDVGSLIEQWTAKGNKPPTQEELEEWWKTGFAQGFHHILTRGYPWKLYRFISPDGQEIESRSLRAGENELQLLWPCIEGFEQYWHYYKSDEEWGWGNLQASYRFGLFEDNSKALAWIEGKIGIAERYGWLHDDYPMGDRAVVVDPHEKAVGQVHRSIYVVRDKVGFCVSVPYDAKQQPDEELADKLAAIIYGRLEANPPGLPEPVEIDINLTGEKWVYPATFAEYNISEAFGPYLITEEEWPPIVIDIDQLIKEELPTQEQLAELKDMIEGEPEATQVRTMPYRHVGGDGFQQVWVLGDVAYVLYTFLRFEDEDEALLWFLDERAGVKGLMNEYPMGDRAMIVDRPSRKQLYVKAGNQGFAIGATVNPYQPDEMLPEKMAEIVGRKLGISESGSLLVGIVFVGVIARKQ